ncbi:MAG: crosslink repair DNA glycosylase YcaQ family protein, partial [Devosia sp.]
LAAYGPASVKDMQTWSGLTRLAPAFEAVSDRLVIFAGEDGRTLYDLPDAPRPDPDMPAPVRFLPDYDNVFLGFADRFRTQPPYAKDRMVVVNGYVATFTVDGFIAGNWTQSRKKDVLTLSLAPFRKLSKKEMIDVEREGRAMAGFLTDGGAEITTEFVSSD